VPLIGWSLTQALSQVCDVHLVTQVRNREAIERQGWVEGEQFTAIDSERIAAPAIRLASVFRGGNSLAWTIETAMESITYPYFEYLVWKRFRRALRAGEYDLVHRVTPVSPTAPSYIARRLARIGIPFVVGPLNGGVEWPREFSDLQRREREWLTRFRGLYRLLPGYKSLRRHASCIIAGSRATLAQLPARFRDKYLYLPENAVDPSRFSLTNQSAYRLPIKAAFVGRLVPYKGADMAIEAMEDLAREGLIEYDIYGTGPETPRLEQMIRSKGLQDSVRLRGYVPNTELQEQLVTADILVFPSVREFGGGVVLEAMALGVVPVIADYAGPTELVSEAEGYKVPMGDRRQVVASFRSVLGHITRDPRQLEAKRAACLARIALLYTWERKTEQLQQVYAWVAGRSKKPSLEAFGNLA
jgi:glycosyltransferase involved in cell wall biosynthesis